LGRYRFCSYCEQCDHYSSLPGCVWGSYWYVIEISFRFCFYSQNCFNLLFETKTESNKKCHLKNFIFVFIYFSAQHLPPLRICCEKFCFLRVWMRQQIVSNRTNKKVRRIKKLFQVEAIKKLFVKVVSRSKKCDCFNTWQPGWRVSSSAALDDEVQKYGWNSCLKFHYILLNFVRIVIKNKWNYFCYIFKF